jgi:two-component system, OmpR family, sensor histidine kinase KdpD
MGRGRLRVYLGAAPGVGKTYAMLGEAHRRLGRGTDVVVALVEAHGRPHTAELTEGLEIIPRRPIRYRDATFEEMDLDAVLARKPDVALVDELAHTNVPGSRHAKRWQDIHDLLDAGIDVISTVNIQHLESLNDVVESITGIKQRETVPDAVVRAADQIELVDMAPEALRRRMAHGNVYAPDKVDASLGNYFRVGNLTALRELALLWLADRVEEGLEKYRVEHGIRATWAARTRIVVAVTGGPESDGLLRRGAQISGRGVGRDLAAVHVVRGDGTLGASPESLARLRQLTEDLGGTFHTVVGEDPAKAVLEFARSVNGTQVVVGATRHGRLRLVFSPSAVDRIVRDSGDIDVHVVTHERAGRSQRGARAARRPGRRGLWAWLLAIAIPPLLTMLLVPFEDSLSLTTVLLAFVLGVVGSSLVGGLAPAVVTAIIAGLLANYFFVTPVGTFTIAEPENAFALLVFVIVAAVVATIVERSVTRGREAALRRAEATVLLSLVTEVLGRGDGVQALMSQACTTFGMRSAALFEEAANASRWSTVDVVGDDPPRSPEDANVAVNAGPSLTLALAGRPLAASELRLLGAFAAQTAAVLERNRLAARAADAARLQASDAVRTSLLAAVSHDVRTPVAGIKASLATVLDPDITLTPEDSQELLREAADAADRLDGLLTNLLDLSRVQMGAVQPVLEAVSLEEIVSAAVATMLPERVIVDSDEDLPLVRTDAGLLERILANLLQNADRYGPSDVPIRVRTGVTPDQFGEIRVIDRGPGVRLDERRRMFEPFQRLGDVPSGTGVGLGLAVARGLAEAIQAEVEAEDTPGGGLTMVVRVPLTGSAGSPP